MSAAPRDFYGYGPHPPDPQWPGGARIAVNLNLNIEAGGEHNLLEGDDRSENALTDIGFPSYPNARSPAVESAFEFGPRAGAWRLLRIFKQYDVRVSILGVARALEQCPDLTRAFIDAGHEIVCHGWRWIDYMEIEEATEREHIARGIETIRRLTGLDRFGWFYGRPSENSRRLLAEREEILYDRDYLGDELPFWTQANGRPHLVIPTSYETNDNRFDSNTGFRTADGFARYLIDAFEMLYDEGAEHPKMLAINLHDRLIGRPGRAAGLIRFLDHVRARDRVWFCTGREIADHWRKVHPPARAG